MSWLANFEDGKSIGGVQCHWTDLPQEKKLTGVQLVNPEIPKLYVCLRNYSKYYFVIEATAVQGQKTGTIVAEIIGGHDTDLGVGTEVRVSPSGSVKVRTYALSKFNYSQGILKEGKVNGKPKVDTVPSET